MIAARIRGACVTAITTPSYSSAFSRWPGRLLALRQFDNHAIHVGLRELALLLCATLAFRLTDFDASNHARGGT